MELAGAQIAVNVRGTVNVLDAAEAVGAERVVHVSSVATWGYDFASDIAESSPARMLGQDGVRTLPEPVLKAGARSRTWTSTRA